MRWKSKSIRQSVGISMWRMDCLFIFSIWGSHLVLQIFGQIFFFFFFCAGGSILLVCLSYNAQKMFVYTLQHVVVSPGIPVLDYCNIAIA